MVFRTEAQVLAEGVNRFHPQYGNFTPEDPILFEYNSDFLKFKRQQFERIETPTFPEDKEDGGLFVFRTPAAEVIRVFLDKQDQKVDTLIYFFATHNFLGDEETRQSVIQYWECYQ